MPSDNNNTGFRHDHMQAELVEINSMMQEQYVMQKAKQDGIPYINIAKVPLDLSVLGIITKNEAMSAMIIPFFLIGDKLRVAVVDMTRAEAKSIMEHLKDKGYLIELHLCSKNGFNEAVQKYDDIIVHKTIDLAELFTQDIASGYDIEIHSLNALQYKLKNALPEEVFSFIVIGGLKTNASDIHIEPMEKIVRLRYRIDGVMIEVMSFNPKDYAKILSQIKYQSRLKLNISDMPQDGRILFNIKEKNIDLRVSILPTEYGETVTIRILDSENKTFLSSFDELGLDKENLDKLNRIISKPNGMLIITGPTGSGKTTTLYSILHKLNDVKVNIITIEDPVEYRIFGVNQVMINEDVGFTFAKALRTILRQDPDIVMVGEIRDAEVGLTATQAALTGHLVLTTLHTNDAISAVTRLLNMGINGYMVSPALLGVIAQRLVRIPCKYCSKTVYIKGNSFYASQNEYIEQNLISYNKKTSNNIQFKGEIKQAVGCEMCSNTGYSGRMAVFELFEIDEKLRDMIIKDSTIKELQEYADNHGFYNMIEDGVLKLIESKTTYEELRRVLG